MVNQSIIFMVAALRMIVQSFPLPDLAFRLIARTFGLLYVETGIQSAGCRIFTAAGIGYECAMELAAGVLQIRATDVDIRDYVVLELPNDTFGQNVKVFFNVPYSVDANGAFLVPLQPAPDYFIEVVIIMANGSIQKNVISNHDSVVFQS